MAGFPAFDPDGLGGVSPGSADGRLSAAPSVRAMRLGGQGIVLDGRLDDAVWMRAETAHGFRVWDPTRGEAPSEQTTFKVAYDDQAIYFGVACLVDGSDIRNQLCRRDAISNSDVISLYLDTYHDQTTCYNFRVNPAGVQEDRYVSDNGRNMDRDWDAVWDAATFVDDDGWYAEMRIPFSCVRYSPSDEMTWGCQLYRFLYDLGEDTSWVNWDREKTGFVSRFGDITGIRAIPAPRQLELLPYAVTRSTDPAATGDDDELEHFQNIGLDAKYGLTADLTLNAAIQPDFGQVEADPSLLNLSPFETYYQEKRPFFVEGQRFFAHPDFNVFYSRRIGTGDENARIRAATKLTGKTPGGLSVAALYALTDVAEDGRAHQFWRSGEQESHYLIGRFGKEFQEGAHRVNLMQTAVFRSADRDSFGDYASRDARTTGVDFDLNFRDRTVNIAGSFVGSAVDPAPSASEPELSHRPFHGTGGALNVRKLGGTFQGGAFGRWETDRLELNDVGFLSAPDEIGTGAWIRYEHNPENGEGPFQRGDVEMSFSRGWLYADAAGYDRDTGELAWSYGRGRPRSLDVHMSSFWQFRSFWATWFGGGADFDGVDKYESRTFEDERGPLVTDPNSIWLWWGGGSDWREPLHVEIGADYSRNEEGGWSMGTSISGRWTATDATTLSLTVAYEDFRDDAQHVENFANPDGGIGGVSYVFAQLDRKTVNATFRADILFSRDLSLQMYAQPYLTTGDYYNARELVRPASYEFVTASEIPGFDPGAVSDYDFKYAAVNVNAVLRWEYRPGSTFYLVWKQGRDLWEDRASDAGFDGSLDAADLFATEPENVLLAKITYWFSL